MRKPGGTSGEYCRSRHVQASQLGLTGIETSKSFETSGLGGKSSPSCMCSCRIYNEVKPTFDKPLASKSFFTTFPSQGKIILLILSNAKRFSTPVQQTRQHRHRSISRHITNSHDELNNHRIFPTYALLHVIKALGILYEWTNSLS